MNSARYKLTNRGGYQYNIPNLSFSCNKEVDKMGYSGEGGDNDLEPLWKPKEFLKFILSLAGLWIAGIIFVGIGGFLLWVVFGNPSC